MPESIQSLAAGAVSAGPALSPDRCFSPDPAQRTLARELYTLAAPLPIVSPHGHVNPRLLADPNATWGSPADLLIIPDHYVYRMLYSRGIPLEALGVPLRDEALRNEQATLHGSAASAGQALERDHRAIWQRFAEHFYLFRGTPTGYWLKIELADVLGVRQKLDGETAQAIYDQIEERLASPEFRPRALFDRFNIEVLCTTDAASDDLSYHREIQSSPWGRDAQGQPRVRPTFRPDAVVHMTTPRWRANIEMLGEAAGIEVRSYATFVQALEQRRAYFKEMGARATDHAAQSAYTEDLGPVEAEAIFRRGLHGKASAEDATRFAGHMLMEMARMSIDDGLVMQLHVGSFRNHNMQVLDRFGLDKGADIPVAAEWTYNMHPLLNKYGNDTRLRMILFTLDESTYSRELAPLVGHYPALRLGPPWWFFDSYQGMRRYLEQATETAGLYNTVGFNDDTRAFASIPARHDLWRRVCADWLAGLAVRDLIDEEDAADMMVDCAYRLAKEAYGL